MRWKQIKEDIASSVPAGLKQEMDRGHAAALKGPNYPVSVILADIDAVLAEMANEESANHAVGSTNSQPNQKPNGRIPEKGSPGGNSKPANSDH